MNDVAQAAIYLDAYIGDDVSPRRWRTDYEIAGAYYYLKDVGPGLY